MNSKTKDIVTIALMTAVICVLAPLSITLPISPVPLSFTTFAIYIILYVLGWKKSTISCLLYLLIGIVGMPVFSGFTGGIAKLAGPTGGYLIGFVFMSIIAGIIIEKKPNNKMICIIGMIAGTAICYIFGTVWLAVSGKMDFSAALAAGVIPFLPGDAVKIILSSFIGCEIRRRLSKAGLINTSKHK